MLQKMYIHEYPLTYEDSEKNIKYGLRYLKEHLSSEESKVFFKQAHDHKSSQFEDKEGRNYTLLYQNHSYVLISRS